MAKSDVDWNALIILGIGLGLLYFNSTVQLCTGWSMINPLCWAGSIATHSLMMISGWILTIVGAIKLIF